MKKNYDLDVFCLMDHNTKQVWVYSNKEDVYIDPPKEVLDNMKYHYPDSDEACEELEEICESRPDWLYDKKFWYNDI